MVLYDSDKHTAKNMMTKTNFQYFDMNSNESVWVPSKDRFEYVNEDAVIFVDTYCIPFPDLESVVIIGGSYDVSSGTQTYLSMVGGYIMLSVI